MEALISVVIPTFRRQHLITRAVRSALEQTYRNVEVIVVIDSVDDSGTRAAIDDLHDARVKVFATGRNMGPAEARNFGIRLHATGEYLALLDDDDEWRPDKLERQMQMIREHSLEDQDFIISCRVQVVTPRTEYLLPKWHAGDDVSEYLLDRRSPFRRCGVLSPAGTALLPRSLALRVPLPNDMHEDWSWVLLCVVRDRIPLLMCDEPLFVYHLDPGVASVSKQTNWQANLEWGQRYRPYMSGKAFAGFLSSTVAWSAKRQLHERYAAFAEIARMMRRDGCATKLHWLTFIGIVLVPQKLMHNVRRLMFFK